VKRKFIRSRRGGGGAGRIYCERSGSKIQEYGKTQEGRGNQNKKICIQKSERRVEHENAPHETGAPVCREEWCRRKTRKLAKDKLEGGVCLRSVGQEKGARGKNRKRLAKKKDFNTSFSNTKWIVDHLTAQSRKAPNRPH